MANPKREGGSQAATVKDERFRRMHYDPRYQRVPKQTRKLEVDDRFKAMFTDKRFRSTTTKDKYGRAIDPDENDELKKLYYLENEEKATKHDSTKGDDVPTVASDDEDASADSEEEKARLNWMRAHGLVDDESSSSDEAEADDASVESESEPESIPTGDATRRLAIVRLDWENLNATDLLVMLQSFCSSKGTVESVTVYPSDYGLEQMEKEAKFGPQLFQATGESSNDRSLTGGGEEERAMGRTRPEAREKKRGEGKQDQKESRKKQGKKGKRKGGDTGDSGGEGEGDDGFDEDVLREYELQKMMWYYAVAVCDSVETAQTLYNECDGVELEGSANVFDLRFVPDSMDLSGRQVRETASEVPATYVPPDFFTRALQHSKVELTWEGEDKQRVKITKKRFTKDQLEQFDLDAYVGSESEGDEEAAESLRKAGKLEYTIETPAGVALEEDDDADSSSCGEGDLLDSEDSNTGGETTSHQPQKKKSAPKLSTRARAKYASLLGDLRAKGQDNGDDDDDDDVDFTASGKGNSDDDVDMEITFTPGLVEAGQQVASKATEAASASNQTVWEEYLEKRKQRKKERKREKKEKSRVGGDRGDPDSLFNDDIQMPSDGDDAGFFRSALAENDDETMKAPTHGKKQKDDKFRKKKRREPEDEDARRKKAELELLVMDKEDGDGGGFDLQLEKRARGKGKGAKAARDQLLAEGIDVDQRRVDLEDPRFSGLYKSHHFHIDPTHPSFRKTPTMDKLLTDMRRKRETGANEDIPGKPHSGTGPTEPSLSTLVESIKRKSLKSGQSQVHAASDPAHAKKPRKGDKKVRVEEKQHCGAGDSEGTNGSTLPKPAHPEGTAMKKKKRSRPGGSMGDSGAVALREKDGSQAKRPRLDTDGEGRKRKKRSGVVA